MVELAEGSVGPESKYSVKFESGSLLVTCAYDGEGFDGQITMKLDASYIMDKLAEAIPGTLDDGVLAIIKAALK